MSIPTTIPTKFIELNKVAWLFCEVPAIHQPVLEGLGISRG